MSAGIGNALLRAVSVGGRMVTTISVGLATVWSAAIEIIDDFTRSAMGPNWDPWTGQSSKGIPQIRENVVQPPQGSGAATAGTYGALWTHLCRTNDQEVQLTIAEGTDDHKPELGMGPMLRCSDNGQRFMLFHITDGYVQLIHINNGVQTPIGGRVAANFTTGATFTCKAIGNRYTMTIPHLRGTRTLIDYTDNNDPPLIPIGPGSRRLGFQVRKETFSLVGFRFSWCVKKFVGKG